MAQDRNDRRPQGWWNRHDVRYLLLAATCLAVLVAPIAVAQSDGQPVVLGERNPSGTAGATEETAIVANIGNNGQSTRQSNNAVGGRAAGYGCENNGMEEINACANYVNRGQGPAAAFRTRGSVPFVIRDTNRGRVANLNADLLDDREAADFLLKTEKAADADKLDGMDSTEVGRELFANVDTNGTAAPALGSRNGATEALRTGAGEYRVDFGDRNLTACSYQASSGQLDENQSVQVALDSADNTRLAVSVHDADAGTKVDGDFNVAVHC
ncbi:MAG: hypothetical protein M3340_18970 [Actinomycetota bacterium]|nr:hypothetical protein [Actinomycetota bacterium]